MVIVAVLWMEMVQLKTQGLRGWANFHPLILRIIRRTVGGSENPGGSSNLIVIICHLLEIGFSWSAEIPPTPGIPGSDSPEVYWLLYGTQGFVTLIRSLLVQNKTKISYSVLEQGQSLATGRRIGLFRGARNTTGWLLSDRNSRKSDL